MVRLSAAWESPIPYRSAWIQSSFLLMPPETLQVQVHEVSAIKPGQHMEFWASGFHLAHPWLLSAFGECHNG